MKTLIRLACLFNLLFLFGFKNAEPAAIENFNEGWQFYLQETKAFKKVEEASSFRWKPVIIPHDWSNEAFFSKTNTGSSTGFLPGGIGWYKKKFRLPETDSDKVISVLFGGVYNNAQVWLNGKYLGTRPYGYSSFDFDLTPYLHFGNKKNTLLVKVDRTNYLDSRWYTGSGIYRDVHLIKKANTHIPLWGVAVTTPTVSQQKAVVNVAVDLAQYKKGKKEQLSVQAEIYDQNNNLQASTTAKVTIDATGRANLQLQVSNPVLWSIENPNLYTVKVSLKGGVQTNDIVTQTFGIRSFRFDANKGFFLNWKPMKLKGVNLHHEAGAVGAAVPIDVWERRLKRLKEIGCNAIRTAHNPVDPQFLNLCDGMGFLVIAEFFDEWNIPKKKDLVKLGDNKAPDSVSHGYPEKFDAWAERDVKDNIRRDRNHPSIILWSIGNEIEWTHPYYSKVYEEVKGKQEYYAYHPDFDSSKIKKAFEKVTGGKDSLTPIARKLVTWVKEIDPSRPTTCGSVLPSVSLASGYGRTVDVMGFNYRATEYDGAHKAYPNLLIYGSENWGAYSEWKACKERDFVAGIFCWTGFAYAGESGPWPNKGLNISFFDFAGFKTARGHFFETLWKNEPHVYIGTTPESESEFKYSPDNDFTFTAKKEWIRRWDWYDIYDKWQYQKGERIIVQAYTNCEENEHFLNGKSLGRKKLSDFKEDNIIKWLVPYEEGELKLVGYRNGVVADIYTLITTSEISQLELTADKTTLNANNKDVVHIEARLKDKNGNLVTHLPTAINFKVDGNLRLLGIDNGAANNVQPYQSYSCVSHNGKVLLLLQAKDTAEKIKITAHADGILAGIEVETK